jgi:hypothetical protein
MNRVKLPIKQARSGSARRALSIAVCKGTLIRGLRVRFRNLFKPIWRRSKHRNDAAAVARIRSVRRLRKLATQSDDEQIRLEAARRLGDGLLLQTLAHSATQESVRMEAAIEIHDQPCLTAIALKAWDIHLGQKAVWYIQNRLLLRRIANSAQQDAIRLAAAIKTEDADLLRQVAKSSNHIDVRWQIAHYLKDPCMLADIAMFKPGNMHLEPLRQMARRALMHLLDRCGESQDHGALLEVIKSTANPTFKIEAFVRLPADLITAPVLERLAAQDLRYIPRELLDKAITWVRAAGWQVELSVEYAACIFCRGKGKLALKCILANETWGDYDVFACPDCRGFGKTPFRQADCTRPGEARVLLKFPV